MHKGVPFCSSFVGKHLLLGFETLASIPCMLGSDDKLWMQTDKSALSLSLLGIYFVGIVISLNVEKFQISFAMTIISLLFVPPIFVDRKELLYCPPEYVQIEAETILKMSTELAWLPSTPIHLCVNWTLVDSTDNPLILSGNNLPNPSWRHLF